MACAMLKQRLGRLKLETDRPPRKIQSPYPSTQLGASQRGTRNTAIGGVKAYPKAAVTHGSPSAGNQVQTREDLDSTERIEEARAD